MTFLTVLNEDVITRILSICDIPTVLSVGQTCKYLNSLAASKSTWLSLITAMQSRINLDIPDGETLQSLTATSLIDLAKRALGGPRSWTPSTSSPTPTIRRRHVLHIPGSTQTAKLLPGGKFLISRRTEGLDCWSVVEDRKIWEYHPHGEWESWKVSRVAEEVIDGGSAVILLVCLNVTLPTHSKPIVEILRLDLMTESSELLRSLDTPRGPFAYEFFHPTICGDLVAVGMRFAFTILVINWRNGQYIELPVVSNVHDLGLVPGHLIVVEGGEESSFSPGFSTPSVIRVWSEACFTKFWRSGQQPSQSLSPPPLFQEIITLPSAQNPLQTRLWSNAHPLYDNSYIIWIFATSAIPQFPGAVAGRTSVAASYKITIGSSNRVSFRQTRLVNFNRGFHDVAWAGASFSGHVTISPSVSPRAINTILPLTQLSAVEDSDAGNPLPLFPNARHMSAYSGALTYLQPEEGTVIVEYYN